MEILYQFRRGISKASVCFVFFIISIMLLGTPAFAQDDSDETNSEDEFTLEEIIITGSRIRTSGMDSPIPVTVVTMDEIEYLSPSTMIEGLAELPQFYGSATTQDPGSFFTQPGAGNLNLRGLNSKRTLQLLDGRRVVQSTIFSTSPDINMFPENLVRSIETVTGGASAAYGTDAVAGVVNFILDTEYEGIKGKAQYGLTERGDNGTYEVGFSGGFALTDRLHLLVSAERNAQDNVWGYDLQDYEWYDAWALVTNPNAGDAPYSQENPQRIPAAKVYSRNTSLDGILRFDVARIGGQTNVLPRYIFDANGVATEFIDGEYCTATNDAGCSTVNYGSGIDNIFETSASIISPKTERENYFAYADFDVSTKLKFFGQAIYGKSKITRMNNGGTFTYSGFNGTQFTIYRDNPFLPDDMRQIMIDNNLNTVAFSRIGSIEDLGAEAENRETTESLSLTGGFQYNVASGFFKEWQVNGYYQYGKTDFKAVQRGGIRLDRIYLAMDVVTDPDTGEPICNVALTTRDTENPIYQDCVPLNLFGRGQASPEAVDWVTGFEPGVPMHADGYLSETESIPVDYTSVKDKQRVLDLKQNIFDIQADGVIYKGWGAGPIRMALGYGYRDESFTQIIKVGPGGNVNSDPEFFPVMANNPALGIRGVPSGSAAAANMVELQYSNVPFARGSQSVHEAFTEFQVPVLADLPLIKQINFTAAGRWAKYSAIDPIYSWNLGASWSLNDELRFRATTSQDVRAATIGEKFDRTGGLAFLFDSAIDPTKPFSTFYTTIMRSNGSPDIEPEKARTHVIGAVYRPHWLEGLGFSIDWYSINVTDNINRASAQEVVDGCVLDGNQEYCDLIIRNGAEVTNVDGDTINRISIINLPYYNQQSVKAEGIDFEIGYNKPVNWFGGGESINLRFLGSYQSERSNTDGEGNVTEFMGGTGFPEWTATVNAGYRRGPFGINLNARWVDDTINRYNNVTDEETGVKTWNVADNTIEQPITVNARVNYRFDLDGGSLNAFFNVQNLFNPDPETSYSTFGGTQTGLGISGDRRGRRYTAGVNFEFK